MAQQGELHGRAWDIAGAALGMQQLQVVRRQRVMPGETRLIDGDAEQAGPLILGQQFSAAYDVLRSIRPCPPSVLHEPTALIRWRRTRLGGFPRNSSQ